MSLDEKPSAFLSQHNLFLNILEKEFQFTHVSDCPSSFLRHKFTSVLLVPLVFDEITILLKCENKILGCQIVEKIESYIADNPNELEIHYIDQYSNYAIEFFHYRQFFHDSAGTKNESLFKEAGLMLPGTTVASIKINKPLYRQKNYDSFGQNNGFAFEVWTKPVMFEECEFILAAKVREESLLKLGKDLSILSSLPALL